MTAKDKLGKLIKSTVDLNSRYANAFMGLSKDYVKALDSTVNGRDMAGHSQEQARSSTEADSVHEQASLLLAGEAGDVAQGAFPITNSCATQIKVSLSLQCDPDLQEIKIIPEHLSIAPGETEIVRIHGLIGENLEILKRYDGCIAVDDASRHSIHFMMVRLKDS